MKHKQKPTFFFRAHRSIFAAAMGGALLSASIVAQENGSVDTEQTKIADMILDALVESNGVQGMAAAVVIDGSLVWSGASGLANGAQGIPVTENSIFRLASVSKLLTVTAAARLYQDGSLDIDAPLQDFVSFMPEHWPAMTSRQLAAHISGIPHYQAVDADRGGKRFHTVEDAVGLFTDRELLFAPGTDYHYSSYGYTLLSAAIEEAAGMPFLDFLQAEIVKDLVIKPDALIFGDANASEVYSFSNAALIPAERHDYSYSWAGAGLSATAPAIAIFGARVIAGEIVDNKTLDMMLTPTRFHDGSVVTDRNYTVGFGWRISRDIDDALYAHHAGIAIGARSALAVYPDEQISTAVLSNTLWVAAIEQTALTLALPFRPREDEGAQCPVMARHYRGEFDARKIEGAAKFSVEDGVCIGVISVENTLGVWLNEFPQKDASTLKIIGVTADGDMSRAALVTPIGIFDLRRRDDGALTARIGNTREVVLYMSSTEQP